MFATGNPNIKAATLSRRSNLARCLSLILALLLVFSAHKSKGQQSQADTGKIQIHIIRAERIVYNQTDSGEYHKFIDSVILQQGTDTLYCDSAYQNSKTKNFEAFADVRIAQTDGTQGTCNYLKYTAQQKLAFMQGNVSLTDGKNNLKCQELTYDLATKVGVYDKGGELHNDSTTVTSNYGRYNVKDKEAHFTGHVIILDPQYNIYSEDVVYNTETKVTRFYAKSTVVRDSGRSILQTSNGYYDGKNGIAHFVGHSSIWSDGQYIEADTLNYNKQTGIGIADGHVISIDTTHHSTMFCGHANYNQKKRTSLSSIKPVLMQVNGKDTLYMRADTFYSAPMEKGLVSGSARDRFNQTLKTGNGTLPIADIPPLAGRDTIAGAKSDTLTWSAVRTEMPDYALAAPLSDTEFTMQRRRNVSRDCIVSDKKPSVDSVKHLTATKTKKEGRASSKRKKGKASAQTTENEKAAWTIPPPKLKGKKSVNPAADTTSADTTAPLYFIGYHHVLIFSDSMQGKCDSISYTRSDSTIRMMYDPIAWAHNSQITGDTILMFLDSSELRGMYVPDEAFMVSQSGPEKAHLYDQVQGKTLTAWFKKNEVDSMLVVPNAESIYYSKDDSGAYLGVIQVKADLMRVYFAEQKLKKIKYEKDVHKTLTPLEKADLPNTKLSRFKWLTEQRPKTKEELFE